MRVSPINNQPIINKAQISKEVCSNNVNFASRLTLKPQGKINDNVFLKKIVTFLKEQKTHFETLLKAFIIATILNTPCSVTGKCGDCLSPECMCCHTVVTRRVRKENRIKIILVGQELGY